MDFGNMDDVQILSWLYWFETYNLARYLGKAVEKKNKYLYQVNL